MIGIIFLWKDKAPLKNEEGPKFTTTNYRWDRNTDTFVLDPNFNPNSENQYVVYRDEEEALARKASKILIPISNK